MEQTLNFLVDARAAFTNLDSVLEQLVLRVNMLAAKAHSIVKGQHSRKTAAFVRSCAAYTFITIPSMTGARQCLFSFFLYKKNCAKNMQFCRIRRQKSTLFQTRFRPSHKCSMYIDLFSKLRLYLLCGQVALMNQALSQADAFFKAAISLIQEVPEEIEVDLRFFYRQKQLCVVVLKIFSVSSAMAKSSSQNRSSCLTFRHFWPRF